MLKNLDLLWVKLARPPHQKHFRVRGDPFYFCPFNASQLSSWVHIVDFCPFNARQLSSWVHSFDFHPFNEYHILGRVLQPKAFLMGFLLQRVHRMNISTRFWIFGHSTHIEKAKQIPLKKPSAKELAPKYGIH